MNNAMKVVHIWEGRKRAFWSPGGHGWTKVAARAGVFPVSRAATLIAPFKLAHDLQLRTLKPERLLKDTPPALHGALKQALTYRLAAQLDTGADWGIFRRTEQQLSRLSDEDFLARMRRLTEALGVASMMIEWHYDRAERFALATMEAANGAT